MSASVSSSAVGAMLLLGFVSFCFLRILCPSVLPCGVFVSAYFMSASVRVERKLFEIRGLKGVVFPLRVFRGQ